METVVPLARGKISVPPSLVCVQVRPHTGQTRLAAERDLSNLPPPHVFLYFSRLSPLAWAELCMIDHR